jgi:hypothetical protein
VITPASFVAKGNLDVSFFMSHSRLRPSGAAELFLSNMVGHREGIFLRRPTMATPDDRKNKDMGEGNYEAAARFDADEAKFIKDHKSELPKLAREAADALDGPEGESLRQASKASALGKNKNPKS